MVLERHNSRGEKEKVGRMRTKKFIAGGDNDAHCS